MFKTAKQRIEMFQNDLETCNFIREKLYVAAICDILDSLGYRNQVMHQRLRPLLPDLRRCGFAGRARTVQWMETEYIADDPYKVEIELMDSLRPGDAVVHSTDHAGTNTPWGELMTTVAIRRGAVGCICDSNVRDCVRIINMGFPVYAAGIRPLDSKGRGIVQEHDVPIRSGGVLVNPGELIFADFDGVVVIPREVESQVLELAGEKARGEDRMRIDLRNGTTLRDAYQKYGIL
jgi:4-hydroxy-4-methyl-2-oxoglutarate aldolase